jgi:hypothetical protein
MALNFAVLALLSLVFGGAAKISSKSVFAEGVFSNEKVSEMQL